MSRLHKNITDNEEIGDKLHFSIDQSNISSAPIVQFQAAIWEKCFLEWYQLNFLSKYFEPRLVTSWRSWDAFNRRRRISMCGRIISTDLLFGGFWFYSQGLGFEYILWDVILNPKIAWILSKQARMYVIQLFCSSKGCPIISDEISPGRWSSQAKLTRTKCKYERLRFR